MYLLGSHSYLAKKRKQSLIDVIECDVKMHFGSSVDTCRLSLYLPTTVSVLTQLHVCH